MINKSLTGIVVLFLSFLITFAAAILEKKVQLYAGPSSQAPFAKDSNSKVNFISTFSLKPILNLDSISF